MRCILAASLLAASLASNALGSHSHSHAGVANGKRRKTLGFGPVHPHKVFDTTPMQPSSFAPLSEESDPLEVAMLFINKLVAGQDGSDYEIRKDSYTDSVTGITHVYAQQYKHSLEVADGVMNLNIKDGVVLSYGNSVSIHPSLCRSRYLSLL
jgi:extracellular elastinolytic metalloproteinase